MSLRPNMFLQTLLVISTLTFSDASIMLHSPRVTNWGNWGRVVECPKGSFVKAINIKVEANQGWEGDDTALNAVRLSCYKLNSFVTDTPSKRTAELISAEGPWGSFFGLEYCYRGVAVGYKVRTEVVQGKYDNSATNDVILICANRRGKYTTPVKGQIWGIWSPEIECPPGTAICGLQTQNEPDLHSTSLDDSSVNNVDMLCCDLPNPAKECSPTDNMRQLMRRDNTEGKSVLKYMISEKVGVQKELVITDTSSLLDEISTSVGFGTSIDVFGILQANFEANLAHSHSTQHEWSQSESSIFSSEREETMEMEIPAGCETILYQIVGQCGPYVVSTNNIKRVDKCNYGGRRMYSYTSYIKIGNVTN